MRNRRMMPGESDWAQESDYLGSNPSPVSYYVTVLVIFLIAVIGYLTKAISRNKHLFWLIVWRDKVCCGGEGSAAGTWGGRSRCVHSQETEPNTCSQLSFSFLFALGVQAHKMAQPTLRVVFESPLTQCRLYPTSAGHSLQHPFFFSREFYTL